jgi:hypothetical protein
MHLNEKITPGHPVAEGKPANPEASKTIPAILNSN